MQAQTLKSVYVMGLGALGCMYAAKLQDTGAASVSVIADPERISKYRNSVFTVNGQEHRFRYISPGDEAPFADLIIVAVKFNALPQAIADLKAFTGPETIIISLLNGISSEELIAEAVGVEHLLHAYAVGMDAMRDGTAVHYSVMGRIVFGDRSRQLTAKVLAVKDLFERSEIPFFIPENIERALWAKFMMNVGINQASTILSAPYQAFKDNSPARELMVMASREVLQLSGVLGIHLNEDDISDFIKIIETLSPGGKSSMLQDMEAKRKTEVEIFAGAVIEMGKKHNIPTPVNETFYRIIKHMESA